MALCQAAARSSPTSCCSTNRPTISTPKPSPGCEAHLRDYKGTILIVTHDRYFLDNITGWILELDRGRGIPYEGNYSTWLEQKAKRLEQEAREDKSKPEDAGARTGMDRARRQGAPGQVTRPGSTPITTMAERSPSARSSARAQIIIPNGPASATR